MRKLNEVIPFIGMPVVSWKGTRGKVVHCTPKPDLASYLGDDTSDYVEILWNSGERSLTYHYILGAVFVVYSIYGDDSRLT